MVEVVEADEVLSLSVQVVDELDDSVVGLAGTVVE